MTTQAADPLLETLVNDFGGNYVFALDVLEQYRSDRRSVDASWRDYFDKALGVPSEPPSRGNGDDGGDASAEAVAEEAPRAGNLTRPVSTRVAVPSLSE